MSDRKDKLGNVADTAFEVAKLPIVQRGLGKLAEALLRQLKRGHERRVARREKRRARRVGRNP